MNYQPAADFHGGWTAGEDTYNPGSDFMNLLGIGSKKESVIIKGQNFDTDEETCE